MNVSICNGRAEAGFLPIYRIFFFILLLVFASISPAEANVPKNVTFAWQANPPEDNVIGYRLYYGAYSRFNSNGVPKSNFSYAHYIDFTDQTSCDAYTDDITCKLLTSEELQCENLFGDIPKCTILKLHGHLYFTLTAYNAQSESPFTQELKLTINPLGLAAVEQAVTTLLLKK